MSPDLPGLTKEASHDSGTLHPSLPSSSWQLGQWRERRAGTRNRAEEGSRAWLPPDRKAGGVDTHIDGIPLKYAQLQEELELDLALLEELLHL